MTRERALKAVSYTHLDVYKRQARKFIGQRTNDGDMREIWADEFAGNGKDQTCLLYTSRCV